MKNKTTITPRIFYVIPGTASLNSMIFAHEEIDRLIHRGIVAEKAILNTKQNLFKFLKNIFSIPLKIIKFKPFILHAQYGTFTAFLTSINSIIFHIPLVITFRGSDLNPSPHDGFTRNILQKLLTQLSTLWASSIICVSNELKNRLWWNKKIAHVVKSGIDLTLFHPRPIKECREILNIKDNENVIIFNAGLSPQVKRLDLATEAISKLKEKIDVRFIVLEGNIPHEKIPIYLNAADCLIFTSDYEGSPNIIGESLACGLPIISVEVGDVGDQIAGDTISKIVPRDPEIIASEVFKILKDKRRTNGHLLAQKLSSELIIEKIWTIYLNTLSLNNS